MTPTYEELLAHNLRLSSALQSARDGLACMSEYIAHKGLPFAFKDSVRETEKLVAEALKASQ